MNIISKIANMNKKTLLFIVFAVVVLGGFTYFSITKGNTNSSGIDTSNANEITQEANSFVEKGDYVSAYQLLSQAEKKKLLDDTGTTLYTSVKSNLYQQYTVAGDQSQTDQKYSLALSSYENAKIVSSTDAEKAESKEKVEQVKGLVKEQEQLRSDFKTYTKGMQKLIIESNTLLKSYKTYLDKVSVGAMTLDSLKQTIKQTISDSDTLISRLDDNMFVQNDTLLEVHKSFINHMNSQHNMFVSTLQAQGDSVTSDMSDLRQRYLEIKTEQVTLIQQVNTFSAENNLGLKLENPDQLRLDDYKEQVEQEKAEDAKNATEKASKNN